MLNFFRKKTKAIIWSVIVCFALWGGYAVSAQFQKESRAPGKIFGKEVSFQEYLLANHAVQLFARASKPEEVPSAEEVEARTWQFLVLNREARRRKISVTDDEVRAELARLLGAGPENSFSQADYQRWVRMSLREEPREFEKQVRENLRIQKLLTATREGFKEKTDENLNRWLMELLSRARIEVYRGRS